MLNDFFELETYCFVKRVFFIQFVNQERMKDKRVNPPCNPYSVGNPSQS